MVHVLVLMRSTGEGHRTVHHEPFVDAMVAANVVVFGGAFVAETSDLEAAYLLRTATMDEAREWVARDPLVTSGRCVAELVEWDLVGINGNALDPELLAGGTG